MKNEELQNEVEKNRDCHQVSDGCECASQQFPPVLFMKKQRPKKRRQTCGCVFHSVSRAQYDGHDWLEDKS